MRKPRTPFLVLAAIAALASCSTKNIDDVSSEYGDATTGDSTDDIAVGEGIFPTEGCGVEDTPCCDGGLCAPSLSCKAGACVKPDAVAPCGDEGQDCCGGGACNAGFACTASKCQKAADTAPPPCGESGQPCCGGGACNGANVCSGATCVPCGGMGQPCCGGGACSAPGSVCSSGGCAPCGGSGQLCCAGGACGGGLICKGSCVPCGGVLQPCCPPTSCGTSLACIGTTCEYCCVLCSKRTAYHRTGATSSCTESAKAFCAADSTRGSFVDAKWDNCAP